MTDDLIPWLRAQLDEDERVARTAANLQTDPEDGWGVDGTAVTPHIGVIHEDEAREHVVRFNPARVLAEVDAKRRILDAYADANHMERVTDETDDDARWDWMFKREALEGVVKLLALPYADRPGYRSEWAP